jgi:hypothetical protein
VRARIAQHDIGGRFGKRVVRVDLHGVSLAGWVGRRVVRWEWIERIEQTSSGVVISAPGTRLELPTGVFRKTPCELARLLEQARSIERRAEVIATLAKA